MKNDNFSNNRVRGRASSKEKQFCCIHLKNVLFILGMCLCLVLLFKINTHIVKGSSMIPTFTEGDRILINKGQIPKRYEFVTLDPLKKPKESYIKRVIGIPNDAIKTDKNTLYLETEENKTVTVTLEEPVTKELKGLKKIPKNSYFVMGDNRNHSNDSRSFGLVSIEQIEGVAFFRYYPLNRIEVLG